MHQPSTAHHWPIADTTWPTRYSISLPHNPCHSNPGPSAHQRPQLLHSSLSSTNTTTPTATVLSLQGTIASLSSAPTSTKSPIKPSSLENRNLDHHNFTIFVTLNLPVWDLKFVFVVLSMLNGSMMGGVVYSWYIWNLSLLIDFWCYSSACRHVAALLNISFDDKFNSVYTDPVSFVLGYDCYLIWKNKHLLFISVGKETTPFFVGGLLK